MSNKAIYTNSSEITIMCGFTDKRRGREIIAKVKKMTGLERLTLRDIQDNLKWSLNY
jgi:hypothetical protein